MRTVTNVGIGVGTAVAAIPLAIGTAFAFQLTMSIAGALFLVSAVLVRGLSAERVDARRTSPGETDADAPPRKGPSPYRDARFLSLTALMGVFGIQFGLYEVAVPLWVVAHTVAPDVLVSPLLLVNTIVVVLLQVRMSRGTGTFAGAGRAMRNAGVLMVLACALWAGAGWVGGDGWGPIVVAAGILLAAALVHSLAEITSSAAGWSLSFDLASQERMGSYQGVYGTGYALGAMVAPAVVTMTRSSRIDLVRARKVSDTRRTYVTSALATSTPCSSCPATASHGSRAPSAGQTGNDQRTRVSAGPLAPMSHDITGSG